MTDKHPLQEAAKHLRHFMRSVGNMADQDSADCVATYLGDASRQIAALEQRVQDLAKGRERPGAVTPPPDPEPPVAELKRWEPMATDMDALTICSGRYDYTSEGKEAADRILQKHAEQAHAHYSQQLASLRSALADAQRERDDAIACTGRAQLKIDRLLERVSSGSIFELQTRAEQAEAEAAAGKRVREELKSRIAELEAELVAASEVQDMQAVIAPRIEPSDEELERIRRNLFDGASPVTPGEFSVIARAVLALTRPPEGAVSWSVKTTMGMAVGIFGCSKEALELPPNQEVHGLFVAVPTGTKEQG